MKLLNATTSNSNDDQFSSDSKADDREKNVLDIDTHITPNIAPLNKIIEIIEDFCDTYIKRKHIKIRNYKAMCLTVQKLEEIYNNF